jgi:hypothetical protein
MATISLDDQVSDITSFATGTDANGTCPGQKLEFAVAGFTVGAAAAQPLHYFGEAQV